MSGDEARADPFFRAYKLALELLMVTLGLWWLFGPLIVFLLLCFGVVDGHTVDGWLV